MTNKYIEKLDKELEELIIKINGLPVGSKERADEIKNLETLSAIRSDIYQKQSENFATVSKVEQDDKKLEQEDLKIFLSDFPDCQFLDSITGNNYCKMCLATEQKSE